MKEATGELNMTVITVVAIAAIAGLFYVFVWPMIQRSIIDNTCKTFGDGWEAVKVGADYKCCLNGSTSNCKDTK